MLFFSKQTPSAYVGLFLGFLILLYSYSNFTLRPLIYVIIPSFVILIIFFLIISISDIKIIDFYNQYISYPSYIGQIRVHAEGFLTPIEFSRYFLKFKFIHLSYFFILFYLVNLIYKKNFLQERDFYILLILIFFSLILIFHQLLSLNQKFVDMVVPILLSFSHIYLIKSKDIIKKKFILIKSLIIFISLAFLADVFINHIDNRRFMDLKKIDLSIAVDGANIDKSLRGLKWVTHLYPKNPEK